MIAPAADRPFLLTGLQFGLLAAWIAIGPVVARHWAGIVVQLWGGLLGLWAAATMIAVQRRMFAVTPLPIRRARLVTTGPYRRLRHPMYTALLLVVLPAALPGSWASRALAVALAATLLAKLRLEERLLRERFDEYEAYARGSWALVPLLW